MKTYATAEDYRICASLHRKHGTTYFFSSRLFPRELQRRVDAVYGFVRVADEWVDNPGELTLDMRGALLEDYERQFERGIEGEIPQQPVLRAFCDVVREVGMDPEEPRLFLSAMSMDLSVDRYPTYPDLQGYMRGSAAAVGQMMCDVMGVDRDPDLRQCAMALGDAMQLTNFLRDIGEDLERGRIYLPLEDLHRFGLNERDLFQREVTPGFVRMMQFEINRARALYQESDPGIAELPRSMRKAVRAARVLYAAILDRIEDHEYDVFRRRVRTSRLTKLATAARIVVLP